MEWLPFSTQLPITESADHINFLSGGMRGSINGLALHITDGHSTLSSLRGHFSHPDAKRTHWGVSAHFAISREGEIAQYLPMSARANAIDSYEHDAHWYSVENVAVRGESLSEAQVAAAARIFLWLVQNKGVPNVVANSAMERGLGYHSMFHLGHPSCPGGAVIRQRTQIIEHVAQNLRSETADIGRELTGL